MACYQWRTSDAPLMAILGAPLVGVFLVVYDSATDYLFMSSIFIQYVVDMIPFTIMHGVHIICRANVPWLEYGGLYCSFKVSVDYQLNKWVKLWSNCGQTMVKLLIQEILVLINNYYFWE